MAGFCDGCPPGDRILRRGLKEQREIARRDIRSEEIKGSPLDGFEVQGNVTDCGDHHDVNGLTRFQSQRQNVLPVAVRKLGVGKDDVRRLSSRNRLARLTKIARVTKLARLPGHDLLEGPQVARLAVDEEHADFADFPDFFRPQIRTECRLRSGRRSRRGICLTDRTLHVNPGITDRAPVINSAVTTPDVRRIALTEPCRLGPKPGMGPGIILRRKISEPGFSPSRISLRGFASLRENQRHRLP